MYLNILTVYLQDYKNWLNTLDMNLKSIETSIFQNDKRNIFLEKFTSFGLSSLLVHTVSGLFTGGTSIIAMLGAGAFGFASSKITFSYIFGNIKTKEDLIESEFLVISKILKLQEFIDNEKFQMLKQKKIYFDYYHQYKEIFQELNIALQNMDQSNLSKIYKIKFKNAIIKYDRCIFDFDNIYTEKRNYNE